MKCADLMTSDLRVVPTTANVQQVARLMHDNSLGFLPVCGDDGQVLGVVTDRDIATRAAITDRLPSSISVLEVMSRPAIVCGPREDVRAAESSMTESGISRVVVVDEDGRPVGVVSLTDLLERAGRGRAVQTARQVLSREASGPHVPIESIHLTPEAAPRTTAATRYEETGSGTGLDSVIAGGNETRGFKEFPR
jgi:CBS domain-containing protein